MPTNPAKKNSRFHEAKAAQFEIDSQDDLLPILPLKPLIFLLPL